MMNNIISINGAPVLTAFALALSLMMSAPALAQMSSFTYQGRLTDSSNPADGLFDIEFKLFDTATVGTGTQQGTTITNSTVQVTNGTFSVVLDFGSAVFDGSARFLEISIRPTGSPGLYTVLSPRQPLNATPYAMRSAVATNATQLGGQPASGFIQNTTTQQVATNFNIGGNGSVGGTLTGGVVNATTQYNINGLRMLVANGPFDSADFNFGATNIFVGESAGLNITPDPITTGNAGKQNSFFGAVAGRANTTGRENSFFGMRAGLANTTGSGNIAIGEYADVGANNLTNATAIGARARVDQSNSLVLGGITGVSGTSVNVGIGTTAPAFKLHVVDAGSTGVRVHTNTAGGNLASFGALGVFDIDAVNVAGGRVRVLEDGRVGIGDSSPSDKLQVVGDIRVGTGSLGCVKDADATVIAGICTSDARLKQKITPFPETLDKLIKLRPVHFYWKAEEFPERRFGHEQSYGLIAQEVEVVMPELVAEDEQGFKAVNYSKLPVLTLQAVKELKAENDALKARLQDQQTQIELLTKAVCQMNPNADFCK